MNANDIIRRALKLCGVLAAGETPSAADADDAFDVLNTMLDRWKAERLTCYQVNPYDFQIPDATASVTIGPTGTWQITTGAPVWIEAASAVQNYGVANEEFEMPIEVYTPQRWATYVTMKTMTNSLPIGIYYQRSAPNGTINIWPVLTVDDVYMRLYCAVPLSQFTSKTLPVSLPPGYEEALMYNLARRLAPMFGRALDPEILDIANSSMGVIKASNENMDELLLDPAIAPAAAGAWNYRTGDYQSGGGG